MTNAEWQDIIDRTVKRVQQISATKGREYTHDSEDRLDNFKRHAAALDVSTLLVWAVYFNKHIDSINTYVADVAHGRSRELSEPIEGRIDDAIVYLLLLKGLSDEIEEARGMEHAAELAERGRQFVQTLGGAVEILNPTTMPPDSDGGEP